VNPFKSPDGKVSKPNPNIWDKCINEIIFCRKSAENNF
jgi:hypothetical protein